MGTVAISFLALDFQERGGERRGGKGLRKGGKGVEGVSLAKLHLAWVFRLAASLSEVTKKVRGLLVPALSPGW